MTHSSDANFTWTPERQDLSTEVNALLEQVNQTLLPNLELMSVDPHDPVQVKKVPSPWQVLGAGNYAAVFAHPDFPHQVIKIYAPNRPGFEEEREVYQRLGDHPAFSRCFYAAQNILILKRLYGITLYDCLQQGKRIPKQVIRDIDQSLNYAQSRGLFPHDIHARNVMMHWDSGLVHGLVVDVSDFLHEDPCSKWTHFKRAYYWIYRPIVAPLRLRVSPSTLDSIRRNYRRLSKFLTRFFTH